MPTRATQPPRQWKSLPDAASYAGVCTRTIRRRIADGSLPASRFGRRLLRVDVADLDKLFRPLPTAGGSDAAG